MRKLAGLFLLLTLLYGCGGAGYLPYAPHALYPGQIQSLVADASARNGVPAALVNAVVMAESAGDPSAISSAGAQGIMQLMPGTAAALGVRNPTDPAQSIDAGARYLREQLRFVPPAWPGLLAAAVVPAGQLGGSFTIAAKLAGGHGMGYEDDVLCGNIVCCKRSRSRLRLGRPVRPSCNAWCFNAASVSLRAEISSSVQIVNCGTFSASRTSETVTCAQKRPRSLRT